MDVQVRTCSFDFFSPKILGRVAEISKTHVAKKKKRTGIDQTGFICNCCSTKESSMLNMVLTVFHLLFFAFIIVAGLWNGSARNLVRPHGLAPYGVRGILDGAAIVYFSYIGYDSASTMAEEIRDPARALPVGIAGSVLVVSALYCLMSVALCVMLPYTEVTMRRCCACG